jgi:hypothetical protein
MEKGALTGNLYSYKPCEKAEFLLEALKYSELVSVSFMTMLCSYQHQIVIKKNLDCETA